MVPIIIVSETIRVQCGWSNLHSKYHHIQIPNPLEHKAAYNSVIDNSDIIIFPLNQDSTLEF